MENHSRNILKLLEFFLWEKSEQFQQGNEFVDLELELHFSSKTLPHPTGGILFLEASQCICLCCSFLWLKGWSCDSTSFTKKPNWRWPWWQHTLLERKDLKIDQKPQRNREINYPFYQISPWSSQRAPWVSLRAALGTEWGNHRNINNITP